jgi:hypothetical protein
VVTVSQSAHGLTLSSVTTLKIKVVTGGNRCNHDKSPVLAESQQLQVFRCCYHLKNKVLPPQSTSSLPGKPNPSPLPNGNGRDRGKADSGDNAWVRGLRILGRAAGFEALG